MMSAAEIRGRAGEWAVSAYERWSLSRAAGHQPSVPLQGLRLPPGISGGRFFGSMQQVENLREVLAGFPDECSGVLTQAEHLLRHRVTLFTTPYDLGVPINWRADPPSGWEWPLVFHRDVFRAPRPPGVDVKHVWELNRHQFLVELATAWLLTSRPEFRDTIRDTVRDWVNQNPFGMGVNWAGPLEVAYRALSWLWTAHLLDTGLDEERPDSRDLG